MTGTNDYFKSIDEHLNSEAFKNGHEWQTYRDIDPDDDDDNVYEFAYSKGFHNGPVCKRCGYSFCIHCSPPDEPCPPCSEETS